MVQAVTNHTPQTLAAFSQRVRDAFLAKRIPAPVHLCDDAQAEPLILIFKDIRPQDWVFCSWRSMFHALLKGIPEEEVFNQILEGRSMYLSSKEHNFMASSIVGGILPIALGVADGFKRMSKDSKAFVFVGDMTSTTGIFHEFASYAAGHDLPVRVVLEDNGLSTNTPTSSVWGIGSEVAVTGYKYTRTVPHVGLEQRVNF